jgi:glucokinase
LLSRVLVVNLAAARILINIIYKDRSNLMNVETGLVVADIGGTNARFGLVDSEGSVADVEVLPCADFSGLADAFNTYIGRRQQSVARLALAVACPVDSERISFTNNHWSFLKSSVASELGLQQVLLVNDFAAQSLAVAFSRADSYRYLQCPEADSEKKPTLVIGPGTGLGVGVLVHDQHGSPIIMDGEGGHVTVSPRTLSEKAHVSAERLVSGPGLFNIYTALCSTYGADPIAAEPAGVVELANLDPIARESLDLFARFFGSVAANACLTIGAGRVVIAGGVVPRLGEKFNEAAFRDGFRDKGRVSAILSNTCVKLQLNPEAALVGLAGAFSVQQLASKIISA